MNDPTKDIEIIELFQLHASVPTNQHTFRTRNPHDSRIAAETPRGKDSPRNNPRWSKKSGSSTRCTGFLPEVPRVSRHVGSSVAGMWRGRLSGARMDCG